MERRQIAKEENASSRSTRPQAGRRRQDGSNEAGRIGVDGRYLYFFHIPKTGGLTVEWHIKKRFGSRTVLRPSRRKAFYTDVFARRKSIQSRRASHAHIVGHFASWTLLGDQEHGYYKACFWRHPADWALSLYNYRLHRNSEKIKRPFAFADFRRSMLRNPMTEHFLLNCGDMPGWAYFLLSDRQKFELACSLAQRFDRFDDITRVDAFLDLIGLEGEQRPPDHRIPAHEKRLGALDAMTRSEIERVNCVDFFLYKLAKSEDHQRVIDDARRALSPQFDRGDILRLIALPYYRFKTWVLPFIGSPASQHPTRRDAARDVSVLHNTESDASS
jgi:hypothetical protein